MAYQALRNGPIVADNRENNGVIGGVGSFSSDLATLGMLQIRLASIDLRDCAKAAAPMMAVLAFVWLLVGACVVVGLGGLALWLATRLEMQPGVVLMIVAVVGLVVAGVFGALAARSLRGCTSYFRRTQEELDRNLAWVKTTLTHSGR